MILGPVWLSDCHGYFVGEVEGEDGKCAGEVGEIRDWRLPKKGRVLQTQKVRTGNDLARISVHAVF